MRLDTDAIDLVVDAQLRNIARADLPQYLIDLFDVFIAPRITGVDHVQQQVRLARFLQRRLERGDEFVRQIADETDRVGQHDRGAARQSQTPHGRIERRKQLIGHIDIGARERAKQRRLAGVGVAHQRHGRHREFRRARCVRSRAAA